MTEVCDTGIWLDDRYDPPPYGFANWTWAKTTAEVKQALEAGAVAGVSLDHNLGMYDKATGLDLLEWMATNEQWPTDTLMVHTSDFTAEPKMVAIVEASGLFTEAAERHPIGRLFLRDGARS